MDLLDNKVCIAFSSLCSCCWIIVASPQKANSSLIFCFRGHLKSPSLCLLILALLKIRYYTANVAFVY